MKIIDSVRKAIDDFEQHELEAAMLHACNAVDGTAKKIYSTLGNNARFTRFLRESYDVLGPMGLPGVDLETTRFPVQLPNPKAPGGGTDLADIIYGIHRCTHGHGDELPNGFSLIEDAAGPNRVTRIQVANGNIHVSDRIIFALLAVVVFSPVNKDLSCDQLNGYYLTFGNLPPLWINEWWGKKSDFAFIAAQDPVPSVTLDFSKWS